MKKNRYLVFLLLLFSQQLFSQPLTSIWHAESTHGFFKIILKPEDKKLLLGQYTNWIIQIVDTEDVPVENARLSISAGMFGKGHGHGMPTNPQVTTHLGKGQYLIEGMLFNMLGEWTIYVNVATEHHSDQARLDIHFDASLL